MRILWWGKYGNYGPNYPRNRTIQTCLRELGHEIIEFRPRFSETAIIESTFKNFGTIDAVWVPCFRQRDVNAAYKWATKHAVPLIFDPLISAYDKQVFERKKFPAGSLKAIKLLKDETTMFSKADWLIADTECHRQFFAETFSYPIENIRTIPVSAEEQLFTPAANPIHSTPPEKPEVLFFGTFISLQGSTYIAEAIQYYSGPAIKLCFLGDGPEQHLCEDIANSRNNPLVDVTFETWVPIEQLADRIKQASICLGVFGKGEKAHRVIPNKVYQSLACNRALITLKCDAYPESLMGDDSGISWVEAGRPNQIASAIEYTLSILNDATSYDLPRNTYDTHFSNSRIKEVLSEILVGIN